MLWIGKALSRIEYLCMQSFLSNGHPVHLYAYDEIDNVPKGITYCDANQLIHQQTIFKHRGSYAAFADLFRWKLMVEKGGWYCDTDVLCIKPFEFDDDFILGYQDKKQITPTIMKFPANNIFAKELLDSAENPIKLKEYDSIQLKIKKTITHILKKKPKAFGWGQSAGPAGLTRTYTHLKKKKQIDFEPIEPDYFYPIHWKKWKNLITPNCIDVEQLPKETCAIHLWNELWRRNNIDKTKPLDPNCLIEKLFRYYCPDYSE